MPLSLHFFDCGTTVWPRRRPLEFGVSSGRVRGPHENVAWHRLLLQPGFCLFLSLCHYPSLNYRSSPKVMTDLLVGATAGLSSSAFYICTAGQASSGTRAIIPLCHMPMKRTELLRPDISATLGEAHHPKAYPRESVSAGKPDFDARRESLQYFTITAVLAPSTTAAGMWRMPTFTSS